MQKANLLAKHFENVFKPQPSEMSETEERAFLLAPASLGLPHTPVRTFKLTEVRTAVASPTEMTLIGRISDVVRSGRGPHFVA
jgi:hypothetical protein